MADGSTHEIKYETILDIRIGKYRVKWKFEVGAGTLEPQDMLLGMDWLQKLNPQISFRPLALKVNGPDGRSYELIGSPTRDWCGTHGYEDEQEAMGALVREGCVPDMAHHMAMVDMAMSVEVDKCSPATCVEGNEKGTKDKASLKEEIKWVNWKEIFPGMTWLPSTPNEQATTAPTLKVETAKTEARHDNNKVLYKQAQLKPESLNDVQKLQSTAAKSGSKAAKDVEKTKSIALAGKSADKRRKYDLFH
ncbi:hypothetical protein LTR05_007482 [Lithohypha guttulata]|uniref:Uncharacterized protein n=1 Tax=Lithohypha guttulata TaxID=1690604 RepID=A0AAN7SV73_9EURO|nr:hypothetical protein LTR05_007482 [Lithohypha guttulata]